MLECCILFSHYGNDETTREHLALLRERNPYPVVAVCNDAARRVEEALDVNLLSKAGSLEHKWLSPDRILYRWFRHGGLRARRYIFLEWDTLATMPVREYYDEVWDADAAGSTAKRIEHEPEWEWFRQMPRLPGPLRAKAGGIVPFNGILLSHRALEAVTSGPIPPNVFCELRLGTLLRNAGFEAQTFSPEKQRTNSFDRRLIDFDPVRPGIYHPIKSREAAIV